MTPTPDSQPLPIDALQFERAEIQPAGRKCQLCAALIDGPFYQVGGADACAGCADRVRSGQDRPKLGQVLRGILFGIVAAIAGAVAYGLVSYFTGMEFALLSILVGWGVGTAVRHGSGGLGGRRCQVAAVLLTFLAIAGGYTPAMFEELTKDRAKLEAAAQKAKAEGKQTVNYHQVEMPVNLPPPSPALRLLSSFFLALLVPFFGITAGISGLLGIAIVFFGLQRAWSLTSRDQRLVVGPMEDTASA